jgi:ADP-ribosyl-[dinitrogen reductase] hydrolase
MRLSTAVKVDSVMVELAVGDAYGACFEFADPAAVEAGNDLSGYPVRRDSAVRPGSYTDDTQMSLAIAETIVADRPWTPQTLADSFVEVFKRDPRVGYTRWFDQFLTRIDSGAQFLAEISPLSDKSGAAMRAGPIGVFADISQVLAYAQRQAALTHRTPGGTDPACVAALMTHYFLYQLGPKAELGQFIEDHVAGDCTTPWQGPVGSEGWMCVRAALTAIHDSRSLSELLYRCVAYTGDVDTVAAIALAAGSCTFELAHDLPQHLVTQLENGTYGREYLSRLDQQLLARVRR